MEFVSAKMPATLCWTFLEIESGISSCLSSGASFNLRSTGLFLA